MGQEKGPFERIVDAQNDMLDDNREIATKESVLTENEINRNKKYISISPIPQITSSIIKLFRDEKLCWEMYSSIATFSPYWKI